MQIGNPSVIENMYSIVYYIHKINQIIKLQSFVFYNEHENGVGEHSHVRVNENVNVDIFVIQIYVQKWNDIQSQLWLLP